MTRKLKLLSPGRWSLHEAKSRFSELVRRVHSDGPRHVTVHGRDEVVVISSGEYHDLSINLTGDALIDAMQASPHRDVDIAPSQVAMPVRSVVV